MTLDSIETALDAGRLEVQAPNGKWYRLRRNGQTRLWKTRPADYRLPCKVG